MHNFCIYYIHMQLLLSAMTQHLVDRIKNYANVIVFYVLFVDDKVRKQKGRYQAAIKQKRREKSLAVLKRHLMVEIGSSHINGRQFPSPFKKEGI